MMSFKGTDPNVILNLKTVNYLQLVVHGYLTGAEYYCVSLENLRYFEATT